MGHYKIIFVPKKSLHLKFLNSYLELGYNKPKKFKLIFLLICMRISRAAKKFVKKKDLPFESVSNFLIFVSKNEPYVACHYPLQFAHY